MGQIIQKLTRVKRKFVYLSFSLLREGAAEMTGGKKRNRGALMRRLGAGAVMEPGRGDDGRRREGAACLDCGGGGGCIKPCFSRGKYGRCHICRLIGFVAGRQDGDKKQTLKNEEEKLRAASAVYCCGVNMCYLKRADSCAAGGDKARVTL